MASKMTAEMKQTFMNGGYFKYDITDKLSVLALNTLYFDNESNLDILGTVGLDQFAWFEKQLQTPNKKFILTYHIYPGAKYVKKVDQMWYDQFLPTYKNLVETYRDKILITVGAHDHFADLRYDSSADTLQGKSELFKLLKKRVLPEKYFFHNIFISPSISPIKKNNPGFSVLSIDS